MRQSLCIIVGLVFLSLSGCARSAEEPKVILIIGDGMDDQQISTARNYLAGSSGRLVMDAMQYRGAIRVQSVSEANPEEHLYVTGSAPAAAAIATGIITSGVRISTFVTTASVTDATPASFMAHVSHRACQGPENMVRNNERNPRGSYECIGDYKRNGGKGSIAEQIADGKMDIVLGGGRTYFDQVAEGESETQVLQLARSNGYEVITSRSELQAIPNDKSVLCSPRSGNDQGCCQSS